MRSPGQDTFKSGAAQGLASSAGSLKRIPALLKKRDCLCHPLAAVSLAGIVGFTIVGCAQEIPESSGTSTVGTAAEETESQDLVQVVQDEVPASFAEEDADISPGSVVTVHPVSRSVQETGWYCGPAVMQMLLGHYGQTASQSDLAREMNTSPATGTEYADMARTASIHVFGAVPESDLQPGFRSWTGTENEFGTQDRDLFLQRLKLDLENGDVLSAAIAVDGLYPFLPLHSAHVVLVNGMELDEQGAVVRVRIEDPSYLVEYASEEEHWFDTAPFLEAMAGCPEPGYIW